jgi:hypothetical protein
MSSTDDGIQIDESDEQPENAPSPSLASLDPDSKRTLEIARPAKQ